MGAAKFEIKQQDRSAILAAMDGIYAGAVVISDKGEANVPKLITDPTQFERKYGIANPANGVSMYGVNTFLSESNKIWVVRAIHDDAKFAAALVRSKIDSLPVNIPNGSWRPDKIVSPITEGLTQAEFDAYNFPVYLTDRVYSKLTAQLVVPVTDSKALRVSKLDEFNVGDALFLGNTPKNDSQLHYIAKKESVDVTFDKITLDQMVSVKEGQKLRMIATEVKSFSPEVRLTNEALGDSNILQVDNADLLQINDKIVVAGNEYTVESASGTSVRIKGTLGVTISSNAEIQKKIISYRDYQGTPTVTRNFTGSNEILVSKADYVGNGDTIVITDELNNVSVANVTVLRKDSYTETHHYIHLDNAYTGNTDTVFNKMVHSEFEDRDAFLVICNSLGKVGNSISIAIAPSTDYDESDVTDEFSLPFNVIVYEKGKKVETFENVSLMRQLDAYRTQMFIEDRINGVSEYIKIKVNPMNVDEVGKPRHPLYTDYSVWRQLPDDIFWDVKAADDSTNVTTTEDLLAGDINIRVTDNSKIALGDRIKFYGYPQEYKVVDKTSWAFGGKTYFEITLDREIIITSDNAIRKIPSGVKVTKFDASVENSGEGIYSGTKYYRPSKVDNVYYNYPLNVIFTISNVDGQLLDCGANLLVGGSNGSPVTVGDLVKALKPFYNKDRYPLNLIFDAGHTYPAFAQELDKLAAARGTCHAYVSIDINEEEKADYTESIVAYYNKLNLNSEYTSVFSGWIRVLDENNNIEIYTDPASAAAASQAFTTKNFQMFYPSAGWTRGKVRGLGVMRAFTAGDMDFLVDKRINPIRYKEGQGLVIWGNETTYAKPSPLQLRSVNWLLIMIKHGLESMLDFQLFELNNERTYVTLETAIRTFMRDEIKAKGGVYDFQVEVSKIITDSDKEQRRVPVFLGIKPTSDVKFIPVTLAIFSASQTIDVSL